MTIDTLKMWLMSLVQSGLWTQIVRVVFLCLCIPLARILAKTIGRVIDVKASPQLGMIARKAVFYSALVLILATILNELGFKLTAILGAAGVAGVAVGFASQTTLSNFISGIFLILEKPFIVGDLIKVGDKTGVVQSIDPLSVKIRTLDNVFVRIPNENLLKGDTTNITRYPVRRMDIPIGVAYGSDLPKVVQVLKDVAKNNSFVLQEPEPLVLIQTLGDSSIGFLFGIWFAKSDYLQVRNSIIPEILTAFSKEGIQIPFPNRTLSLSEPIPVKISDS